MRYIREINRNFRHQIFSYLPAVMNRWMPIIVTYPPWHPGEHQLLVQPNSKGEIRPQTLYKKLIIFKVFRLQVWSSITSESKKTQEKITLLKQIQSSWMITWRKSTCLPKSYQNKFQSRQTTTQKTKKTTNWTKDNVGEKRSGRS